MNSLVSHGRPAPSDHKFFSTAASLQPKSKITANGHFSFHERALFCPLPVRPRVSFWVSEAVSASLPRPALLHGPFNNEAPRRRRGLFTEFSVSNYPLYSDFGKMVHSLIFVYRTKLCIPVLTSRRFRLHWIEILEAMRPLLSRLTPVGFRFWLKPISLESPRFIKKMSFRVLHFCCYCFCVWEFGANCTEFHWQLNLRGWSSLWKR